MAKLSKDAIEALDYAYNNYGSIQWIAMDCFRIWYTKRTEEGTEFTCRDFTVSEVRDA